MNKQMLESFDKMQKKNVQIKEGMLVADTYNEANEKELNNLKSKWKEIQKEFILNQVAPTIKRSLERMTEHEREISGFSKTIPNPIIKIKENSESDEVKFYIEGANAWFIKSPQTIHSLVNAGIKNKKDPEIYNIFPGGLFSALVGDKEYPILNFGDEDGGKYIKDAETKFKNVKVLKESLGTTKFNKIQSLINECLKEGMEVEISIPKSKCKNK